MKKQRIPNGKCTKEFREEAVKLITEEGLRIREAGRGLYQKMISSDCQ